MGTLRKIQGILALVGSFLIFLTLGSVYSFGNFTTYLTSYIRERSEPKMLRYGESAWAPAMTIAGLGGFMFLGGLINLKLSARWTTLIGCIIVSAGVFSTYFTVKLSFFAFVLTYGVVFGAGVGIAYAPPLALAMQWYPTKKGLVNGIALAGFGAGAFIFNQVQSFYINPKNKAPDKPLFPGSDERYFSEEKANDVLDRVPPCFLLLGGCYITMQLFGCLVLFDYKPDETGECELLISDDEPASNSLDVRPMYKDIENHVIPDVHPLEMLKCKSFYMLWFMSLFTGQAVTFISTLYKTFGQTFIHDDQFLALVGAVSSLFNAGGRIFWGHLADRFSFRTTMMVLCTSLCVLMLTFYSTIYGGRVMYFVWVCGQFLSISGTLALFPTVIAKTYGPKYMPVNFGLLFTSQVITATIGALLTTSLPNFTSWFGMFCIIAAFAFIALVIAYFFNVRKMDGSHV